MRPWRAVHDIDPPGRHTARAAWPTEARVGAVRTGQKATITCDTFRDRTYPGEVVYISSEAEFTPKNVQTHEERVQRLHPADVAEWGDGSLVDGFDQFHDSSAA